MVASRGDFLTTVGEISGQTIPVDDAQAEEFLSKYPLGFIFQFVTEENVSPQNVKDICSALGSVLSTSHGLGVLPSALEYAAIGIRSPFPEIRKLCCAQLDALIGISTDEVVVVGILPALLLAVQDDDLEVGATALKSMQRLASSVSVIDALVAMHSTSIQDLVSSPKSVPRLRALDLLLCIAAQTEYGRRKIEQAGLLDPVLSELDNYGDPLSCLSAWNLFGDLVNGESNSTVITGACELLGPKIATLLESNRDPAVVAGMLQVVAPIISKGVGIENQDGPANGALVTLLEYIQQILEHDRPDLELLCTVLDAIGHLGGYKRCAERVILTNKTIFSELLKIAIGQGSHPEARVVALHSVAAVCGSEWMQQTVGQEPELLPLQAEHEIQSCFFRVTSGQSYSEAVWGLMESPVVELRIALYRAMSALVARPWFASGICLQAPLFEHITHHTSEWERQANEWRYSCLQRLAATARRMEQGPAENGNGAQRNIMVDFASKLEAAVLEGPFGSGGAAGARAPIVATERR